MSGPRICISCKEWKPHSKDFRRQMCGKCYQKHLRATNGDHMRALKRARYHAVDPAKKAAEQRSNYLKHREKRLAWMAAYFAEHRAERLACHKQWATEHREEQRQYHRDYRGSDMPGAIRMREQQGTYSQRYQEGNERYAESHRARQALRRAKGAEKELVTIGQAMFDADGLCHLCGAPILSHADAHLDHIVPLSKGGQHTMDNLAPTHARCNQIKRGLHPDEIPLHIQRKFHAERAVRPHIEVPNAHLVPGLQP